MGSEEVIKSMEIVISYRNHKTEEFFVLRAQPRFEKSRGFMVESTHVTLSTVRPMLTAVREGRLTLTAVNIFFSVPL